MSPYTREASSNVVSVVAALVPLYCSAASVVRIGLSNTVRTTWAFGLIQQDSPHVHMISPPESFFFLEPKPPQNFSLSLEEGTPHSIRFSGTLFPVFMISFLRGDDHLNHT